MTPGHSPPITEQPYKHYVVMPLADSHLKLLVSLSASSLRAVHTFLEPLPAHGHGPGQIHAILLASATSSDFDSTAGHSTRGPEPLCSIPERAYRMTITHGTSSHRRISVPCFRSPPSRSLPPVDPASEQGQSHPAQFTQRGGLPIACFPPPELSQQSGRCLGFSSGRRFGSARAEIPHMDPLLDDPDTSCHNRCI